MIPLYAEEITISKKIVKVGEIAISKRRIVEKENVDVNMIKERINVEYGDGRKEKITPYWLWINLEVIYLVLFAN